MAKSVKFKKVGKLNKIPRSPLFVTPREAAAQLDCSEETIRNMIRSGTLQGAKLGGRYKALRSSVDALLARLFGRPFGPDDNDSAAALPEMSSCPVRPSSPAPTDGERARLAVGVSQG
jgi:excisionase family DNA binding protein